MMVPFPASTLKIKRGASDESAVSKAKSALAFVNSAMRSSTARPAREQGVGADGGPIDEVGRSLDGYLLAGQRVHVEPELGRTWKGRPQDLQHGLR